MLRSAFKEQKDKGKSQKVRGFLKFVSSFKLQIAGEEIGRMEYWNTGMMEKENMFRVASSGLTPSDLRLATNDRNKV